MTALQTTGEARLSTQRVAQAAPVQDREYLLDCWRAIQQHRTLGAAMFLAVLTMFVAWLWLVQPLYRATALVMIEGRRAEIIKTDAVLSGVPADFDSITSELQVIQSRDLVTKMVEKLALDADPEFDPNLPQSASGRLAQFFKTNAGIENFLSKPPLEGAARQTAIVDKVKSQLDVAPVGRSRVIGISFSSRDPMRAMAVVNTLSQLYVADQSELKEAATKRANEWIKDQLDGLRRQADEAGRKVAEFRVSSGHVEGRNATLIREHLSDLNAQLTAATGARLQAAARLEGILRVANRSTASSDVLNSRLIQELRNREAEVANRRSNLGATVGDKNPQMQAANAELADIQQRIAEEIRKISVSVEGDYRAALEHETSLRNEMQKARADLAGGTGDEVRLEELQEEARADRALYVAFLLRYKETKSDQSTVTPEARIISHGAAPQRPYFPNYAVILPIGIVVSAIASLVGLLLINFFDRGFRSAIEVERTLGIPVVGLVPAVSAIERDEGAPDPISLIGTAMTQLYMRAGRQTPKSLLVTSALPMEGKTTVALCLARLAAANGKRVLFVDGDLRRSGMQRAVPETKGLGLSNLLTGSANLSDIWHADAAVNGLTIVASGSNVKNPAGLLAGEAMQRFLAMAKEQFDLVVVDSPAVMAGADAWLLSQIADETLFFVRWARTPRPVSAAGLQQLVAAGGKIAGAVLTFVDMKRISEFSATDGISYSKELRRYYPGVAA